MAYGLPTRGQADWDDELNNSMEALRGIAETADSNADSARDTALSALNIAQASRESVLAGNPDSAFASLIEEDGSATQTALSASYGPVMVATGGDDTTALNAAIAACPTGETLTLRGTFDTSGTVTVDCNLDARHATINYTGTGTALRVGSTTTYIIDRHLYLPRVIAASKTVTGWAQVAGSVGVELANLNDCQVWVPGARNFETGLQVKGYGQGCVHNTINLGDIANNKVNQRLDADATGWSNQNIYIGGELSHESAEGTNVTGTRHIHMENPSNVVNGNIWIGTGLEGDTAELELYAAGQENIWQGCRWESTGGANVHWYGGATTARNVIQFGYGSHQINQTYGAGLGGGNQVWTAAGVRMSGATGTAPVLRLENQSSSANPTDVVMAAGSASDDSTTNYLVSRSGEATQMKRAGDAYPRLKFDHVNGRIYLGDGANPLAQYISAWSANNIMLFALGHIGIATDNTYDLGVASGRPRDLKLGRNATIGGALDHDGTTVGFYGTTPVTKPTALTAANAGTLNTGDATSDTVIGNMRTRIAELEAKLQALGLIT